MFLFACLVGVYTYILFLSGIDGLLYKNFIIWFSLIFVGFVLVLKWRELRENFKKINKRLPRSFQSLAMTALRNKIFLLFVIILFSQVIVNLIGALGPELAFD